jgi:hypothetical protein
MKTAGLILLFLDVCLALQVMEQKIDDKKDLLDHSYFYIEKQIGIGHK